MNTANIPNDYVMTACPGDEAIAEELAAGILGDRFDELYESICEGCPETISAGAFIERCQIAMLH